MNDARRNRRLMTMTAIAAALGPMFALPALAQDQDADAAQGAESQDTIVVTGSRIRRSTADTAAPVTDVGLVDFEDRGYVSAAEALNQIPSLTPQLNQADGSGDDSGGSGQQFPDLFGIGSGRTLTLVNGRRFVTSSNGLEEPRVDTNVIPMMLLDRIEIVQAGGAAVYGSDAIAGVVNYVLKDDFEGFAIDVQVGDSAEGDYFQPLVRAAAGFNFGDGRGNVAISGEWSETPSLLYTDRRAWADRIALNSAPNPDDTGPNDGIPDRMRLYDRTFQAFNENGVIFGADTIPPCAFTFPGVQPPPIGPCFTQLNGSPIQFSPDGQSIIPYDPGQTIEIPFAEGGDGTGYEELFGLRTGVERFATNLIGHYDLTDNLRLNAELLYARTVGETFPQGDARTVLSPVGSGSEAIRIYNDNPFLSQSVIDSLTAARPSFATGAPLFLSKHFYRDLFPANSEDNVTSTYRALLELEGDFDLGERNFYWTTSASYAEVEGEVNGLGIHTARFFRAVDAASDGAGGAVCRVNVDADATNDDPACVAFNPFGVGQSSQAARDYVIVPTGQDFNNEQVDVLATVGTDLFTVPAGAVKTVLSFEHRDEYAEFIPSLANQQGIVGSGTMQIPTSGSYYTDELAAELLVPIVDDLPFADLVEFSGSYRYVDNSIAGTENVWGTNLRWIVSEDLTLRATRSRNFRAPTLTQIFQPTNVSLTQSGIDPCDSRDINNGPAPDVRRANCEAEWAQHPDRAPLDVYQNESRNFTSALITSGGNPDLENEVSDTWTFGFVLQPRWIPSLTFSVDRIEIDLANGLSPFTTEDFAAVCYDSSPQPAEFCSAFTREDTDPDDLNSGSIVTGRTTFVNAGSIRFKGEVYALAYEVPLDSIFRSGDPGRLLLSAQATHKALHETSVTGFDLSRTDGTVTDPDWVGRFDAAYDRGPWRVSYQLYYIDSVKANETATIDNSLNPVIASNTTHSLSGSYAVNESLSIRGGVKNLTDRMPSFPTFTHGDLLGRRYFVGADMRF